ncbi:unnamed protein product [Amoebophrya sp. A120]|nr:unnamed protein product [Amoebophrya sp. A120]|eukprot:GSA120T00023287001.1
MTSEDQTRQAAEGLFLPGVPVPTAGASVLLEMEEAKKKQDLPALRTSLLKARQLPGVNTPWIDNALQEIENLQQVQQQQGGTNITDIARQCKDKGNAALKEANNSKQKLKQAGEHYTTGVTILSTFLQNQAKLAEDRAKKVKEGVLKPEEADNTDPEKEKMIADSKVLLSQLYSNRAQVLLQIREFSGCVDDCKRCLALDNANMKAYYRAARASLLNGLFQQAVDFCTAGIEVAEAAQASSSAAAPASNTEDLKKLLDSASQKLNAQKDIKEKLSVSPQELMDQQQNVQRLYGQLQQLQQQIFLKKQKQRAQLVTKEYVKTQCQDVNTYVSCGKVFVMRSHDGLVKDMEDQMESLDAELPKMEKAHAELKERFDAANAEFEAIVKHMNKHLVGRQRQ